MERSEVRGCCDTYDEETRIALRSIWVLVGRAVPRRACATLPISRLNVLAIALERIFARAATFLHCVEGCLTLVGHGGPEMLKLTIE
jgi:hypothetical protein